MKFLFTILFICLFIGTAFSAPAQHGIALNHDTNKCAAYWPGDEFTNYSLENGWKAYFPSEYYEGDLRPYALIETEVGSCILYTYEENECCNQIGYSFIDKKWPRHETDYANQIIQESIIELIIFPGSAILLLLIVIVLSYKLYKKSKQINQIKF